MCAELLQCWFSTSAAAAINASSRHASSLPPTLTEGSYRQRWVGILVYSTATAVFRGRHSEPHALPQQDLGTDDLSHPCCSQDLIRLGGYYMGLKVSLGLLL